MTTAGVTAGEVQVLVRAEISRYTEDMRRAQEQANTFSRRATRSFDGMTASLGRVRAMAARVGVALSFTGAIRFAEDAFRRTRELENRITVLGREATFTARQVEDVTRNVADSMGTGIAAAREAANVLLRLRLPRGEFESFLDLSARLANSGFGTMATNAQRLALALRAPREALLAFNDEGFKFTRQQVEQVRALTAANRMHEAAKVVLGRLKDGTKDVREQIPPTFDAMKQLVEDIAVSAGKALGIFNDLKGGAEWLVNNMRYLGDLLSGRLEDSRIRNRGLEQLSEDITRIETTMTALRKGGGFGPNWRRDIEALTGIQILGGGTDLQLQMLDQALARFQRIRDELVQGQLKGTINPFATRGENIADNPAKIFQQGDYLASLQKRLDLEKRVLFMNEAQARVEETLFQLRERHIALSPKQVDSLRNQIYALDQMQAQMRTLQDATQSLFGGMTNALTEFAVTGKFKFKEFADSVIRDMLRIAMQSYVMRPIMQALPGIGGSLFGGGGTGINPASWLAGMTTTPTIAGAAAGGSFQVPGSGSGDKPTMMGLAPQEIVTITPANKVGNQKPNVVLQQTFNTSNDLKTETREREGPDGSIILEQVVSEVQKRIGRGDMDGTFGGRFGLAARTARR